MKSLHLAFKEYGEDIKEYQWLIYLNGKTGQTEFKYHAGLEPFVAMGWLKKIGDKVTLGDEDGVFLDKIYESLEPKPIKRPRAVTREKDESVKEYIMEVFELPADFHINAKYRYQLQGLCSKFGKTLVLSVAAWYHSSKDQLPKGYQSLSYQQFMSHGVFEALNKWMTDGIPAVRDSGEVDFRNRVC